MSDQFQIPEWTRELLIFLGNLWGIKALENRLTLEISGQMTRSLGNCYPREGTVRLNGALLNPPNSGILREVICHEAAHAAVFLLYGSRCRPHGREWKTLMKAAQFSPRVNIPGTEIHGRPRTAKRKRYRYTHRCQDCGRVFRSLKTDYRWRCKNCIETGLNGTLELIKRQRV